ncbi:MAG: hypothetical protein EOM12_04420 [Verrucomicrobiae bacterium]|nr:hypothetical protein [Verrucomicrobiae bacterium]
MKKILMILTSHRLDCFNLCIDLLVHGGSIHAFDHVVLLLNGVKGRHRKYVEKLIASYADIPWDIIDGPRGRGKLISHLQNQCVSRYPDGLYFKIDEDTFVSQDWVEHMVNAYEVLPDVDRISLFSPIITNNGLGCYYLLSLFPALAAEYLARFNQPITPSCDGPVWINPRIAEWITRRFLNLEEANQEIRATQHESYFRYLERFSINCICYDYRHWLEIGGVPEQDEMGWGNWIREHNRPMVLITDSIVHHYSFFVQQRWLDRTRLLEDIRNANLPRHLHVHSPVPRIRRILSQIPRYIASNFTLQST